MITRDDIQSWLDRLDGGSLQVSEIEPNIWVARNSDGAEFVVHYAPPVVLLRVRVMELPPGEPRRGLGGILRGGAATQPGGGIEPSTIALPATAGVQCPRPGSWFLWPRGRPRCPHRCPRTRGPRLQRVRSQLRLRHPCAGVPPGRARAVSRAVRDNHGNL